MGTDIQSTSARRRPVAAGSGRVGGSGLRRRTRPRTSPSQDDTNGTSVDQSSSQSRTSGSTSRGRLGVIRQNNLPALQKFDEEEMEFGSFPSFTQSRGRQGRK